MRISEATENSWRAWTAEEDQILTEMAAAGATQYAVSQRLCRPLGGVYMRAKRHLLVKFRRLASRPWTDTDIAILREMAPTNNRFAIGAKLGRSSDAVGAKALTLRIKIMHQCGPMWDNWNDELIKTAVTMWKDNNASATAISNKLGHGISKNAVIGKMYRLGLHKGKKPPPPPTEKMKRIVRARRQPKRGFSLPSYSPIVRASVKKLPKPLPPADDSARVALEDLEYWHCRWIAGDPQKIPRTEPLYCGHKRKRGLAYCAEHSRRAYRPTH